MNKIPKRTQDRIASTLKSYQAVAEGQKRRDVSEADTVTLVKDILADCFGFNKYEELTSEHAIRGTFCDLAVKIDGKVKFLIEVKSAATTLNDGHLKQALNYGSNEGIEWIVLTNACEWRLHRIKFGQPVEHEEVSSFSFLDVRAANEDDMQKLFLMCREGLQSDAMDAFHQRSQILNKFTVAQAVLSESVVASVRKELRRLFPDAKFDVQQVHDILFNDVLKREVVDGDKAKETQQRIKKLNAKLARAAEKVDKRVQRPSGDGADSAADPGGDASE